MNRQLNASFFIYQSNRLEILAEKLAENLGQNPLPPLQREAIIVQYPFYSPVPFLSLATHKMFNVQCSRFNVY